MPLATKSWISVILLSCLILWQVTTKLQGVVGCLADVKYMHECSSNYEAATNVFLVQKLPISLKMTDFSDSWQCGKLWQVAAKTPGYCRRFSRC